MKKPTKKQFDYWSIPSQAAYLNNIWTKKMSKVSRRRFRITMAIALLGLILKVTPWYIQLKKEQNLNSLKQELANYSGNGDWQSLGACLSNIDKKFKKESWYNYYYGVYASNSNPTINSIRNPEYYLTKVNHDSEFFDISIIRLLDIYNNISDRELFIKKMKYLEKRLDNLAYTSPEYFLLILAENKFSFNQNKIVKNYLLMEELYKEAFSKKAGQLDLDVQKRDISIPIELGKLSKIYAVSFLYSYELYKHKILEDKTLKNLKVMYPSLDAFNFALYGLQILKIDVNKNRKIEYIRFIEAVNKKT